LSFWSWNNSWYKVETFFIIISNITLDSFITFRFFKSYWIIILTASISTASSSFNSLFRVLFILPLRYLFAIGFPSLFSLRCIIPPYLSCTLKQLDSLIQIVYNNILKSLNIYRGITFFARAFQLIYILLLISFQFELQTTFQITCIIWFRLGLVVSSSLAVTKEITIVFFSSAY